MHLSNTCTSSSYIILYVNYASGKLGEIIWTGPSSQHLPLGNDTGVGLCWPYWMRLCWGPSLGDTQTSPLRTLEEAGSPLTPSGLCSLMDKQSALTFTVRVRRGVLNLTKPQLLLLLLSQGESAGKSGVLPSLWIESKPRLNHLYPTLNCPDISSNPSLLSGSWGRGRELLLSISSFLATIPHPKPFSYELLMNNRLMQKSGQKNGGQHQMCMCWGSRDSGISTPCCHSQV